ncbi:MAG: GNAT family N-acetyltransferase [Alphaproteobacteria bacterium]|nr:GNAT family N-acetyltransferase [Alphaproteobacteria bacterium]
MTDIIPLAEEHYGDWLKLYQGYAAHYQVELTDDGVAATWRWLMDPAHPCTGVVASVDGKLVGLAHVRAMPSPLRGAEVGFLDDLFVDPSSRGGGVGADLLDHLNRMAEDKGWPVIRWITRDNNYRARTLYDRKAVRSDWITYEMKTGEM